NPVAMGSKPTMMPATPLTVSARAGLQAPNAGFLICWMVTESGQLGLGNCVAEATLANEMSAATARQRANTLGMGDPLAAGGRIMRTAIRGSGVVCWRFLLERTAGPAKRQ